MYGFSKDMGFEGLGKLSYCGDPQGWNVLGFHIFW